MCEVHSLVTVRETIYSRDTMRPCGGKPRKHRACQSRLPQIPSQTERIKTRGVLGKPDNLSLTPWAQVVEGEARLLKASLLCPVCMSSGKHTFFFNFPYIDLLPA